MVDPHICPDCNLPTDQPGLCPPCDAWRASKMAQMSDDYEEVQRRRRRRMYLLSLTPSQRFAEACADLVKATQRSENQA